MIKYLVIGLVAKEGLQQVFEIGDRRRIFSQAREYSDNIGKPLLVVGAPKFRFSHPCGDITIDISPEMAKFCNGQVADIRDIPYPDSYFGAAFVSHVLEHLSTIDDAELALNELYRVSDKVFIASPNKSSIMAWLNPHHHLWITADGDGFIIEQRSNRVGKREEHYLISMMVQ